MPPFGTATSHILNPKKLVASPPAVVQQVPYVNQTLAWCKRVDPFPSGNARIYSRVISIDRRTHTVTYEDRGKSGKSVEDVLTIEGGGTMFIDEGADGQVESGEIDGVFFWKATPPGQMKRAQEAYTTMLERIAKKGKKEDSHDVH